MHLSFIADIFAFLGSLGALGVILGVIVGALYGLCPLIIMLQLHHISRNGEAQIKLTRQLLRAYGHLPDA